MAERIVERLIRERDTRYGDGIYTTTQIQFAWNSNHMEGSTLTAKQTAQLFATGTYTTDGSEQVNPDDALETRNHFAAFRWILDHADEPVDRDMVCHLHAILKQGTRQVSDSLFNVGGYKTRPNFIGNPVTPTRTALPQDVPEFMDRLFDMCTKLEDEPYQIDRRVRLLPATQPNRVRSGHQTVLGLPAGRRRAGGQRAARRRQSGKSGWLRLSAQPGRIGSDRRKRHVLRRHRASARHPA